MIIMTVYIVLVVAFLLSGLWVAGSLGLGGFLGILSAAGPIKTALLTGTQCWNVNTSYTLVALPLFVFMGEMLFHSGFMDAIYSRASTLVHGLPGGLLQSNVLACAVFAACCGSSLACAATVGSVAYPLEKQGGYDRALALGSICAGGTLGILIPPSISMIIYGALVGESVGRLFIAGVIPGLILATLFSVYIAVACLLKPSYAPARVERVILRNRLRSAAGMWPLGVIVIVVMGGLYGGIATPTEVSGLGATLAIIFAALSRRLSWGTLRASLLSTVKTTSLTMFIVIGAQILSTALIYYNLPPRLGALVSSAGISPLGVIVIATVLYLVLGMFLDGISMMVLTLPFVVPILKVAELDLIWFGIYLTVLVEMGFLTPPVGLNLFVVQGVTSEPLSLVIKGTMPFLIPMLCMLILLILFPQLALWLPRLMG